MEPKENTTMLAYIDYLKQSYETGTILILILQVTKISREII